MQDELSEQGIKLSLRVQDISTMAIGENIEPITYSNEIKTPMTIKMETFYLRGCDEGEFDDILWYAYGMPLKQFEDRLLYEEIKNEKSLLIIKNEKDNMIYFQFISFLYAVTQTFIKPCLKSVKNDYGKDELLIYFPSFLFDSSGMFYFLYKYPETFFTKEYAEEKIDFLYKIYEEQYESYRLIALIALAKLQYGSIYGKVEEKQQTGLDEWM